MAYVLISKEFQTLILMLHAVQYSALLLILCIYNDRATHGRSHNWRHCHLVDLKFFAATCVSGTFHPSFLQLQHKILQRYGVICCTFCWLIVDLIQKQPLQIQQTFKNSVQSLRINSYMLLGNKCLSFWPLTQSEYLLPSLYFNNIEEKINKFVHCFITL